MNNENNKQNQCITGYLTNRMYSREDVNFDAVVSAFISFIYKERKEKLEQFILSYN